MHHITRHLHLHSYSRSRSRSRSSISSKDTKPNTRQAPDTNKISPIVPLTASFPPSFYALSTAQRQQLLLAIQDYQLTHSLVLKYRQPDSVIPRVVPIGVSVFPTPFPKTLWEEVQRLQGSMAELYLRATDRLDETDGLGKAEGERDEGPDIGSFLQNDPFAKILWDIYLVVKREGYVQDLSLGIFRSDYMVHVDDRDGAQTLGANLGTRPGYEGEGMEQAEKKSRIERMQLKQIEMNTFSVAGVCHATNVAEMHRLLSTTLPIIPTSKSANSSIPPNPLLPSLISLLASTHALYTPYTPQPSTLAPNLNQNYNRERERGCRRRRKTAILIPVQPSNFNPTDERLVEYALWREKNIPTYRAVFPDEVLERCRLGEQGRELLFRPPTIGIGEKGQRDGKNEEKDDDGGEEGEEEEELEISLIYWRAGYEPGEYINHQSQNESDGPPHGRSESPSPGIAARTLLSLSRAIHAPDLLTHLATFKSVQAALARASTETLVSLMSSSHLTTATAPPEGKTKQEKNAMDGDMALIRKTVTDLQKSFLPFVSPSSVLSLSPDSTIATAIESDIDMKDWVLKPNLEGGGHVIFGEDIPGFLSTFNNKKKKEKKKTMRPLDDEFVLQRLVRPPIFCENAALLLPGHGQGHGHGHPEGLYSGPVVSEVGGVGGVLFRRHRDHHHYHGSQNERREGRPLEILRNSFLGYTLKSRPAGTGTGMGKREMSVVKGYAAFDWPFLVDD